MAYQNAGGNLGLRSGGWVFLEGSGGMKEPDWLVDLFKIQSPDASVQLFDLSTDSGQKINVQEKHPEKVKEMAARLYEIINSSKTP